MYPVKLSITRRPSKKTSSTANQTLSTTARPSKKNNIQHSQLATFKEKIQHKSISLYQPQLGHKKTTTSNLSLSTTDRLKKTSGTAYQAADSCETLSASNLKAPH